VSKPDPAVSGGGLLFYQTEDGQGDICEEEGYRDAATCKDYLQVQAEDGPAWIRVLPDRETVWLPQMQVVQLFQTTEQNISLHIRNIPDEGELRREATVKDYLTVRREGKGRSSAIPQSYLSFPRRRESIRHWKHETTSCLHNGQQTQRNNIHWCYQ
jgi:hypothetical protein